MKGRSVTQQKGEGHLRHNNREFVPRNADRNRIKDNIILKKESLQSAYNHCFGDSMREYNDNQKRKDRRINDYFEHLFRMPADATDDIVQSKDKAKSFYEDVVQIGDIYDTGIINNPEAAEKAKNALIEYAEGFSKRNKQFYVFNAVIHMDESTPHLHIDYIPMAYGYSRGMFVQNGYDKALAQMGYKSDRESAGFQKWREHERDVFREICTRYGLNPKSKEEECGRGHTYTPEEYKKLMREAEETKANLENEYAQKQREIEEREAAVNRKIDKVKEKMKECEEFAIKHNRRLDKLKEREAALADKENELNERKEALDLRELHIEEEIRKRANEMIIREKVKEDEFSSKNNHRELPFSY